MTGFLEDLRTRLTACAFSICSFRLGLAITFCSLAARGLSDFAAGLETFFATAFLAGLAIFFGAGLTDFLFFGAGETDTAGLDFLLIFFSAFFLATAFFTDINLPC